MRPATGRGRSCTARGLPPQPATQTTTNWSGCASRSSRTRGLLALIPLGIYLAFREKSRFVAFHALQATAFQLAGLIVYFLGLIALIVLTVVAWVVSGLLSIILIGILLIPLALLVTMLFVVFLLLFPLAQIGYALYAAVEAGRGVDFDYYWIGDWLRELEPSWYQVAD